MRIEMEDTKKQEDDHDSSVLNPKQSLHSELTGKERRLLEREKIRGMGFKKKLEYIWMYYKTTMIVVLGLILAVKLGIDWYHNFKTETVLSISAVNSGLLESEEIEEKIKTLLGVEGDEYSRVSIAFNLSTENGLSEFGYYGQVAYVTQIQAGEIDVLIFPEDLYDSANNSGIFSDLSEILDEETKAALGDRLKKDYIAFGEESSLGESFGLSYDPVCVAVPLNAGNPENAGMWIASLLEE